MARHAGRDTIAIRPTTITIDSFGYAEGSALIRMGNTAVLCNASVEAGVPPWMKGQKRGWITSEYSLLPRSTHTRNRRERATLSGRTQEIQRLIGRALRVAVDLDLLGEYTVTIDCDVLQADGGTRTASITGGYVALALALHRLTQDGRFSANPLVQSVAAISAGYVDGQALLDLDYEEDSNADLDCNIVKVGTGDLIEVQCTAEGTPISRKQLDDLLDLADLGIDELFAMQQSLLVSAGVTV